MSLCCVSHFVVAMLNVIMLSVIMLGVFMLNVFMLNDAMLRVVEPQSKLQFKFNNFNRLPKLGL
jgi:hypothetical protein